jgi:hypothetical protein
VKVPEGAILLVRNVTPQHVTVPVVLMPQAISSPALTLVNVPDGACVSP